MAGELEHIRPTHPSLGYLSSRTKQIIYNEPNGTSHSIKAVYWSPTNNINDIKLIWQLPNRTLVAGTQNVAIEYDLTDATQDLQLTSIEIFTDSSSNSSAKIKIIHESGLYVAAFDGDTKGTQETLYELSGYKHSIDNINVTLYKGHKYYFVYQGNTNEAYYPAYFQNDSGNYKVYANATGASQVDTTVFSTLGSSHYKGFLTKSEGIVGLSENDWFAWNGGTSQGMQSGHIYVRSNIAPGDSYTFTGIIGDANSYHHPITNEDLLNFLNKPYIQNKPATFIWYVHNYPNMNHAHIYAKTVSTSSLVQTSINYTDWHKQVAAVIKNCASNNTVIVIDGNRNGFPLMGNTYKLKSGYTSQIVDLTPLTSLPSSPVENGIYYLDGSIGQSVGWNTNVFVYNNGNYTNISTNNYTTYLVENGIDIYMTDLGSNTQLIKNEINTNNENFFNATLNTDKHFYLKLNNSIEV